MSPHLHDTLSITSDLSDYYPSVEWDIISRVAKRRTKNYYGRCPDETYVDVVVNLF